jgi:signal transduction histidine kinase
MIETVRRISAELRPGVLDDLGLVAAIEWQTEEFRERSGLRASVALPDEELALSTACSTVLFRMLQEALTNIARHARATAVDVSLRATAAEVALEIRDNGRGITAGETDDPRSLGLLGMKERLSSVGGRVDIRGEAGKGPTVTAIVPRR